ncbi:MAG: FAD-dependent oxidoreductase, partial [Lentisphaeria bacterium]|nr:FAD-dependent oxidoreductase [Lentisphaeria bacterium]
MSNTMLFLEAESFEQIGGWVIDQQFMDEMGSPFLLAHGLGRPVEDAVTTVLIPASTPYRVWVRTRDWVGEWKGENVRETLRAQGAPGIFKVLINDEPLASTFGVEGKDWHWQDGGMAHLEAGANRVSLHDLTGLEGRCDAVLLSSDLAFTPPNDLVELSAFRRTCLGLPATPSDAGAYDLVVVGGGIAGICAAVAAARCDLSVAMIQDRPVVGGNNSSEVRVWLGGSANGARFPRVGDVLHEFEQERKAHYGPTNTADLYED